MKVFGRKSNKAGKVHEEWRQKERPGVISSQWKGETLLTSKTSCSVQITLEITHISYQLLLLPSLSLADSYGAPQASPYNSYDSYSGTRSRPAYGFCLCNSAHGSSQSTISDYTKKSKNNRMIKSEPPN
jgi:hypothetical protein